MTHRGDPGEGERARLAYLNELAREVSRVVRHTLDCVRRLLTTATDEAGALLVTALRSLSHCLERVFDSFADTTATTTTQHHRHLNVGEMRRRQRTLSEGLLRCMKGLILQGARMLQEVKRRSIMLQGLQSSSAGGSEKGECTTAIGAIETEFKDTVHRFVVDLREIIRLQHIITEGDREQGFGGGNNSGPCSLPSRHLGAETGAGGVSMASSISHRSPTPSELATAAVRTYQPATPDGQAPKPEGVWQRACVGVGETGEVRTAQGTLAHGIAARRLMSLGQRASREVEHGGIDGAAAAAAEARDASSQAAQPPFTVHPYRKSRIVYGFKVKEGAMKLKVELQQTEEEEEEGIAVESDDDDDVQTSEAGQQRSKADISDEQFVSMMLDFFGEMEQRKAALAKTPPPATRNPRPVASTTAAAPFQAAVPSAAPAPHAEAEPAAGEPAVDAVAPALMRSPPPPQEPCEEGKAIKAEPAASPIKQHHQQQKADEGGKRRQGSKMREGKWYMCMLS